MSADTHVYRVWVERPGEPETNAVFHCRGGGCLRLSVEDILARVTAGVTKWLLETPEGRDAVEDASWEFNIGDLDLHLEAIKPWLEAEGIYDVRIEGQPAMRGDWQWDTTLITRDAKLANDQSP